MSGIFKERELEILQIEDFRRPRIDNHHQVCYRHFQRRFDLQLAGALEILAKATNLVRNRPASVRNRLKRVFRFRPMRVVAGNGVHVLENGDSHHE
jgi:hypothetical protein